MLQVNVNTNPSALANGTYVLTTSMLDSGISRDVFDDITSGAMTVPLEVEESCIMIQDTYNGHQWVGLINFHGESIIDPVDEVYHYLTAKFNNDEEALAVPRDICKLRMLLAFRLAVMVDGKPTAIQSPIQWSDAVSHLYKLTDGKIEVLDAVNL